MTWVGAGICLELEPEPEILKMGGSGNSGIVDSRLRYCGFNVLDLEKKYQLYR